MPDRDDPGSIEVGVAKLLARGYAVVLDADSTVPRAVISRQQGAEEVIGEAVWAAPSRILVAVPSLEALLFRRPDAVARAFGPVSEIVVRLGRISPHDAYEELGKGTSGPQAAFEIIQALDDDDVAALRAESPIRELVEFLVELRRDGLVAAGA